VTSLERRRREVCSERDARSSKTIRMASAGGGRLGGGESGRGTHLWCCVCFWSGESARRGCGGWREVIGVMGMAGGRRVGDVVRGCGIVEGCSFPWTAAEAE
jgi:hypothetical protein